MTRKKVFVKKVIDGDTFIDDKNKKYRLANIDAPEKGKPGYQKTTNQLKKLIEGAEVSINQVARDRYGRPVVKTYKGRESINKKMQIALKK
jgi:endonuclease YncB( thermonuclease family)